MTVDKFGVHVTHRFSGGYYFCCITLNIQDTATYLTLDGDNFLCYNVNNSINPYKFPLPYGIVTKCTTFNGSIGFVVNSTPSKNLEGLSLSRDDKIFVIRPLNSPNTGNGTVEIVVRALTSNEYE